MNNPLYDQPENPQPIIKDSLGNITTNTNSFDVGLTKLEAFTMAAMQGIISNQGIVDTLDAHSTKWVSEKAVSIAKSTLAALNCENKESGK